MIKKHLLKIFLLCVLLTQVLTQARAQYAIGGTAGTTLVNSVYWLTWDQAIAGSTMISHPAGADGQHIINGTYVWQFSPSVRITAIISNLATTGNVPMQAYTPGTYSGDGLDLIYSGNNKPKDSGSLGVLASGLLTPYGGVATFDIDIKIAILINGLWTNVTYPGMIIADAESIDAGGEYISGTTPNAVAWQLLNKRTQGNGADDHYKMDLSNGGRSFKLYADLPPGNFGVQAVMFARNASKLNDVSMKGSGLTSMAIGFVLPFDLGDDPAGYGTTGSYMEQFQLTDYYNGDGTFAVVNYPTNPLIPKATVFIGDDNVDADGEPNNGDAANNDNLTGANDENTINPAILADVKVNQAGNIVINLPVTNTKNIPATLRGWLDFNGDGLFEADELVSANIPANTANQIFTLTYPNASFINKIKVGPLYARFRVSTTLLIDNPATPIDERSQSFTADGETEDYRLKDILGITIAGNIFNDGNGASNGVISGTGIGTVSGTQLNVYLVNSTNTIVAVIPVPDDGSFSFNNINAGTYTLAVSANNVAVGGQLSAIPANLPPTWVPSGEAFGINNTGNTGIEPGTPNLQIQVKTPGTGFNISGVAFGLNQRPVSVNNSYTSLANTPVPLDVLANDSDPDGTLNLSTVLLVDPADNVKKKTVTIAGQGTYVVNNTTGIVTFTPLAAFSGNTTPLAYTVKDNFGTESPTALISINISNKPAGIADDFSTPVNTPITYPVKANDGPSGATSTVLATDPPHGTVTVDAQGRVVYTPDNGYIGPDTFTYTLTSPGGEISDPITVNVSVLPTGVTDNVVTNINTPSAPTTVISNDGPSGANATVTPTNGAHGTTTVDAQGNVIYTPNTDYAGKDVYTYTLTKNGVTSAPITVNVTVKPVGTDDSNTTPINTPVATTVKLNDGPSGTGTTVTQTNGAHGTTTVNAQGVVTYTPANGYAGTDTYTYTLTTPDGVVSEPITVTINVIPVGVNDTRTTPVNTPIAIPVKNNDGVSGTNATVTPTAGTHGTTTVDAQGVVTYTPDNNYVGVDIFTYTLDKNGSVSAPITVTVTVLPVGVNDAESTPVNIPVAIDVKANDGDAAVGAVVTPTNGAHGTTTVDAQGVVTYTPNNGYTGTDTFTYTLTKNGVTSAPITVNMTIYSSGMTLTKTATNSGSKAGDVINYTLVVKNTGTTILNNITITDAGADAGSITPANIASLAIGASVNITAKHTLTLTDILAGSFSNQASASGTDPANNTISDPASDDPTTPAANDPTVIVIVPSSGISITKTGIFSSNSITYSFEVTNTGNTLLKTVKFTDNKLGLTNANVTNVPAGGLVPGASVTFSFPYTLVQADKDAGSVTNQASVSAVDPANNTITDDASVTLTVTKSPIAANDVSQTSIGKAVNIPVLTNDDPLTSSFNQQSIEIVQQPAHGTVTANSDGTVTYTPDADYSGPDSFTYRVKDLFGYYTNIATVTLTINPFTGLQIPNLFTPNGDGINDVFEIRGASATAQIKLFIVNRWGNEVYRSTSYQNNWTGNGLNEGTYYYIVDFKDGAETKVYKGYITLIRTFKK